jgi:uncharacterized protein YrrD
MKTEATRMRKLRSLTGMSVICGSRRIGRVLQAELTEDLRQLSGIWVGAGLLGTRFIPSESLEMLGEVAVMAEDRGRRRSMRSRPLLKRAVSTDGRRMGAISGAEVDELSFAVTALELSSGLWEDLAHRRRRVTRYTVNPENGEVVVDLSEATREEGAHEGWIDEGPDHRHADRWIGGDGVRRHELADGEAMEPEGPPDGQLDL